MLAAVHPRIKITSYYKKNGLNTCYIVNNSPVEAHLARNVAAVTIKLNDITLNYIVNRRVGSHEN